MQAVIRSGSKQYLVEPGYTLEIDVVPETKQLSFEPLLVIDGTKISVGTPVVAGVIVTAEVIGEVKGEKLQVLKFQAKKRVNTKTGHRQHYTQIKINSIGAAKAQAKAITTAKPSATKPAVAAVS